MNPTFIARGACLDAQGTLWCDLDQVEGFVSESDAVEMHYHVAEVSVVSVICLANHAVRKVRPFRSSHN